MALKIYQKDSLIAVDTGSEVSYYPQGQLRLKRYNDSEKLTLWDAATKQNIFYNEASEVLNEAGASYGNTSLAVVNALAVAVNFSVAGGGGSTAWGAITGALSAQTDLQNALNGKATPADIAQAIANLVNSSPTALDTLNELANALGNDANFANNLNNAIAQRQLVSEKNAVNGYAGLDAQGKVSNAQISRTDATFNRLNQTGAVGTTTIFTATSAGLYRLYISGSVQTLGNRNVTGQTITHTESGVIRIKNIGAGVNTNNQNNFSSITALVFCDAGTVINYANTLGGTTGAYNVRACITKIT